MDETMKRCRVVALTHSLRAIQEVESFNQSIFADAVAFNQDISTWNVSSAHDVRFIARSFGIQPRLVEQLEHHVEPNRAESILHNAKIFDGDLSLY